MKKSEKNAIIKWSESVTDEELEKEYYDSVDKSLGSQAEQMYELGYDMVDIAEREKYEKYLSQRSDVLENLCKERGIKLWQQQLN